MLPKWTVLNIGSISRNKFWGEREEKSYREIFCTCTLIQTDTDIIVVDPSMAGDDMAYLLDSRCGILPGDVTKVFVTHTHGDHTVGMDGFPHAQWFMMPGEIASLGKGQEQWQDRFIPAGDEIASGIGTISLPGHTPTLGGLIFNALEGRVVVAGGGVMTRDFFRHRMEYHNSQDPAVASQTLEMLANTADVIVPGHDNYFYVKAAEAMPKQEIIYTK
jgi:glyoxylase-like metal-dependent hydrolase (beta-lactamase superfamily II)